MPALTRVQTIWRWLAFVLLIVVAAVGVRSLVASPAEVFWCLFPICLLAGSRLGLYPFPQLGANTRIAKAGILCGLIAVPIVFYVGLVWATNSVWSWTEMAVCLYFFCFALECFLLIVFAGFRSIENWIAPRVTPRWRWAAVLVQKVVMYALLVPFLLVTISAALTFGFSRYRLAAEISLVVLAGAGLDWLVARVAAWRRGRTADGREHAPAVGPSSV